MFRYLPEQASEVAPKVDWIHNWITDISVFFTVAICGAMVYFAVQYRKRGAQDHETPQIVGNNLLEIIWTVVPTIISIWVAYYGIVIYNEMVDVSRDEEAVIINAQARRWAWDFQYSNGKSTTNEFVVPVGRPVKVVLTSRDVLHSFFVPAMRVKKDVVPGRYTYVSFTPVQVGTYPTFCTEYCGTHHSAMLATLKVVSAAEFDRWQNDRTDELAKASMPPAELGKKLYFEKGCNACHSLSGQKLVGPSFLQLLGSEKTFLDGTAQIADEDYIRDSIINPNSKIVSGYLPNLMPSFAGQLSDNDITGIIEFIRTLDGSQPVDAAPPTPEADPAIDLASFSPEERGKRIYETKLCITCHSLDGSNMIGPTFKDLYMRKARFTDGTEYQADEDYIKNSILNPASEIVEGYQPVMPPYQGQLSDDDLNDLIAFMKSIDTQ